MNTVRKKIGLSKQVHPVPPEPADYRHREHPLPGGRAKSNQSPKRASGTSRLQNIDITPLWPNVAWRKRNISLIKQSHTPGDNISKPSLHLASSDLRSRYFVQEIHYQFSKQLHITTQSESHPTGSRCPDLEQAKLSKVKAAPGTPLLHRTNQRYHE